MLITIILSSIALLIALYLIITLYLKCKMPFWSKQPVFHIYNLLYWIRPPGIIDTDLPLINKYVDLFHIKTFSLTELSEKREALLTSICNFIKNNYIVRKSNSVKNNDTKYTPTKNNITDYLEASNHESYFSVYQVPKLLLNKSEPEACIEDIVAVISIRPLNIRFSKRSSAIYYVDNLCVQPAYRKQNIASTMIQTHHYNLRRQNTKINTYLFKREGQLNAIVPLVAFNTYCIALQFITSVSIHMPPSISFIEIGQSQLHLLVDFIKLKSNSFACVILPDVSSVANLIKTENIKVYALIEENTIIACYIFRLIELYYDGQKTVECICMLTSTSSIVTCEGFALACKVLQEKKQVELVLIEDTAHAHIITDKIASSVYKFISPTAFFLYNYACYSIKKNEFLIIY